MTKEYADPLLVTSPPVRGQKVKDAQWLLAGNNRFKGLATYKDGKIDGIYGVLTAQATKRAKWWLGYPDRACDGVFGQTIYEYLRENNWRPLPDEYRQRRDRRIVAHASNPGERALEAAKKEIGYHESPAGSNLNKYGKEYGFNGVPWCAIFESIMFKHTGTARYRYAAVQAIYWDAASNRNGLYLVRTPRPGDVIGYKLHGDPYAHTAFFVRFIDANTLVDLGGNTGPANVSNGGEVMEQRRSTSVVNFYARVT